MRVHMSVYVLCVCNALIIHLSAYQCVCAVCVCNAPMRIHLSACAVRVQCAECA